MRCYRVDEAVCQGIPLKKGEDGVLGIEVGNERVLLDEAFSSTLLNAKERVIQKLRACLDTGEMNSKRLTDSEIFELDKILEVVEPESINLLYGDLMGEQAYTEIVRESNRSPNALVLLETGAGIDGQIEFMSNTFYEYYDQDTNRVMQAYDRRFPPAGVSIIHQGKTPQGTDCYLLEMAPNSSIRIERTGKLDGAPKILTLSWRVWRLSKGGPPLMLTASGHRGQ